MSRPVYSVLFSQGTHSMSAGDAYGIWAPPVDGNTYVLRHLMVTVFHTASAAADWKLFWEVGTDLSKGLVLATLGPIVQDEQVTIEQDCRQVLSNGVVLSAVTARACTITWSLSGYKLTPT